MGTPTRTVKTEETGPPPEWERFEEDFAFWRDISDVLKEMEAPADDHTAHHELVLHRTRVREHLERLAPLAEAARAAYPEEV